MCQIQTPNKLKLPLKVAEIIKARNPHAQLIELDKQWLIEAHQLLVFESWFDKLYNNIWGNKVYNFIWNCSSGRYRAKFDHFFIIADKQPVKATIPIPFESFIIIDELSRKFNLSQSEIILGLITQISHSLTEIEDPK